MSDPISYGTLMGVGIGSNILSDVLGYNAQKSQQNYWNRLQKKRTQSPEADMLRSILGDMGESTTELPILARREMEGALASREQQETSRLNEALRKSGTTGASDISLRAREGMVSGLESKRQKGLLDIGTFKRSLQSSQAGLASSIMQLLYPSPGQTAQGAQPQSWFDPTSYINDIMMYKLLGPELSGTGSTNTGGNANTNKYNALFGANPMDYIR